MFGGEGAWKFHERLLTDYDGVVKVHGVMNVRISRSTAFGVQC